MDTDRTRKETIDTLVPSIYAELRRLAGYHLRRERPNHTLQPTELVNEVFLLLQNQHSLNCSDRTYVLSLASTMMRRILVNYAMHRSRQKRGGANNISIDDAGPLTLAGFDHELVDIIALERSLRELANRDVVQVRIVEMHFFGAMTFEEIASALGISLSTVNRKWRFAKAWLLNELS